MKRTLWLLGALLYGLLLVGTTDGSAANVGRYERFAVAADHPLGSQAGLEVLQAGGSAADAAAAVMLAIGVVNPASSGLGGGGFALYYRASDRSLTFLDFRERAPAAATADMFRGQQAGEGPASRPSQLGGKATGVPGEPAGIAALLERFGTAERSVVTAPAIRYAEQGFAVSEAMARMSDAFGGQMRRDSVMRRWFTRDATALTEGQVIRNPALGRTIRELAARGAEPFYHGRIAREIVRANQRAGGIMTLQDLADYQVVEREPLTGDHFGLRWVTAPPPSAGGYTMLASLALLERYLPRDPRSVGDAGVAHALAESWKGPFWDRASYFGDPDHVDVPVAALREARRTEQRAALFHPTLATDPNRYALPLPDRELHAAEQPDNSGTSHLCVVDAEGNVAAITTTVNLPFGARYTAAGMAMNDEMDDFASEVGEANAFGLPGGAPNLPGPGRRPVSTMSPTIVFRGELPALCVGASGGSRIVTATEQVALRTLVFGSDLADAVAHPRVHHQGWPNELRSEEFSPLSPETLRQLAARGHQLGEARHSAVVQAIALRADSPRLVAVSDPRKGGTPAGE